MSTEFDNMELEELENLLQALQAQKDELRQRMIEVRRVMGEKRAVIAAQRALDRMSDAERAALHQIVGVKPARAVGIGKDSQS